MEYGFWKELKKPIFALAPMYDVTDAPFRAVIAKYGKPDVIWTEFVSAEGLNNEQGRERLEHHLIFSEIEKPIVAQIFGSHPEHFAPTSELCAQKGFDGIDINMGCPDKNIIKQGSCSALFNTPELAKKIVREAKRGAGNLPVSVKIRIGNTKVDWKNWIASLLEAEPAAITIHLRTRKEMSKVPAHWELMPEMVEFIKEHSNEETRPIILGNGDVKNLNEAKEKIAQTGCDGVMIGRGIFGNPWLFSGRTDIGLEEKFAVLLEHTKLFENTFGADTGTLGHSGYVKNFEIMKKHYKAYVNGFDGAKDLRAQLMEAKSYIEIEDKIKAFLSQMPALQILQL